MRVFIPTVIVLFAICALGEQNSQPKRAHHRATTKEQETQRSKTADRQPAPVAEVPSSTPAVTPATTRDQNQSTDNRQNVPKITDWIMVALTAAYVLVSVFLWFAVKRQAEISDRQANIAREAADAAKIAAEAAINSATTAKESVRVSEEGASTSAEVALAHAKTAELHAQAVIDAERPWIVPEIKRNPGGGVYYDFWIRNFGRTPAQILSIRPHEDTSRKGSDGGLPEEPDYGLPTVFQQSRILAPKKKWRYHKLTPIASDQRITESIANGSLHLMYWGIIEYRDVLRPDIPHETRFCFTYNRHLGEFVISGPSAYTKYT